MKAKLTWEKALRFTGTNEKGHQTHFDTSMKGGGLDSAASPMEVLLEAAAACTAMDVVGILQKKRRSVIAFSIELEATRAEQHPKVFTKIMMDFHLISPDATGHDLSHAIELSHSTYCSVSIMLARSGCEISWQAEVTRPSEAEKAQAAIGGTA